MLWAAVAAPGVATAGLEIDPTLYSYRERPGAHLPEQSVFRDSAGRAVRLSELSRGLPLILVPAYFHCPGLCGIVRASLFNALRTTGLQAGRDYVLAVLSIDPSETSVDARTAKEADLVAFGSSGVAVDEFYLTGDNAEIRAVEDAVGFRERFDLKSRQFIHPAGVVFLTPDGSVSNYLLGVGYTPSAVRSAVQRAAAGRLAAVGSSLLLICFHFDPASGRYSLEVVKLIRLAAVLTALTLAAMLLLLFRGERGRP
jgi:protein SCO1/2